MNQFATNLNTMLDQQPATAQSAPKTGGNAASDAPADPAATNPASNEKAAGNGATAAATSSEATQTGASSVRKINGPAAAPIELSDVAGSAILKRALPLVGGLVLLWIIVRRLRRH